LTLSVDSNPIERRVWPIYIKGQALRLEMVILLMVSMSDISGSVLPQGSPLAHKIFPLLSVLVDGRSLRLHCLSPLSERAAVRRQISCGHAFFHIYNSIHSPIRATEENSLSIVVTRLRE
jgi:hypothetical protein